MLVRTKREIRAKVSLINCEVLALQEMSLYNL